MHEESLILSFIAGSPKRSGDLTFTEDYSTVMTQISEDGYSVRGHYGTVFLPLGVTKGTILNMLLVGPPVLPLIIGKWYYEVALKTAGSMEIGWASSNTIDRYGYVVSLQLICPYLFILVVCSCALAMPKTTSPTP